MYLGNIITEDRIENVETFISIKRELDKVEKPTLIIGWKLAKKLFPSNVSILNKKINNNLYWTFSKKERKVEYEYDIDNFYKYIISNVNNNLTYYYFDVLKSNYKVIKKFFNLLKSDMNKFIYIHNNSFMYLYYDRYIIGISLDDIDYIGINSSKIINKLYNFKNIKIFYDLNFLSPIMKKLIYNNIKITPFLYANLVN